MASMNRFQRLRRDESGMTYVFIGMGLTAFLSASILAIDVGMLMTARSQAQNSADAGALAGATALLFDDFNDRSPSGPAVTSAIAAATANRVMRNASGGGGIVSVTPDDVEFLNDPEGQPTRVKVTVYRTSQRGNPVSTLIAQYFGVSTVGIGATATAEVSPANAMTCVKPFTIPDKWREAQTPPWTEDDTYDAFDNRGVPLANPDVYVPADQPGYTGYNQESNRGARLVIRAATGNNITVSFYYSLALGKPVVTGGDEYRWNIDNCNTTIYHWKDPLVQEPGAMAGPTIQGADDLIARDPGAYWDDSTGRVRGSAFGGQSPRVFPIPLYDPVVYDSGKRNGRTADLITANWIGFFLESTEGNGIWGRIIPIAGIRDRNAGPAPAGLNPKAIRLVE
jgi:Flp pilus assembly protein TadG